MALPNTDGSNIQSIPKLSVDFALASLIYCYVDFCLFTETKYLQIILYLSA